MPTCIILVGFGYGIGVGPVPFALMGEILPQKIKNFACGLCLAARYIWIHFVRMNDISFSIFQECYNLFQLEELSYSCIILRTSISICVLCFCPYFKLYHSLLYRTGDKRKVSNWTFFDFWKERDSKKSP